ncbi:MAG: MoxR family ATPase [Firmicutes bacterium]|jgi:MoxR-like ATPase|nr:MoxR family ATPase [Bacillota bacterium]NBI62417.1 MoxR family ATPase [Clostridiales bacterium]
MENVKCLCQDILQECRKVIVGNEKEIKLMIMSIFSGGHVLIEAVPGTGKTTLVKTMAKILGLASERIQFVSDLMPSDILGVTIYDQKDQDFKFRKGPIFTNILLADEINRAVPRTQSALLEAMEEHQVTIDGNLYALAKPFVVMATQNPVEFESTFNLPLAQLDRFFVKISLSYPKAEEEAYMLANMRFVNDLQEVSTITQAETLLEIQSTCEAIHVSVEIIGYVMDIIKATREKKEILVGASPRAAKSLVQGAKAWAMIQGRDFVTPDDIQELAVPMLAHRMIVNPMGTGAVKGGEAMIKKIIEETKVRK